MPTPQARAAFHEAKELGDTLRKIHDHEHEVLAKIDHAMVGEDLITLRSELQSLRVIWCDLLDQYNAAVSRYVTAVDETRAAR